MGKKRSLEFKKDLEDLFSLQHSIAFADADKNHDGYLSMEEYVRVFKERSEHQQGGSCHLLLQQG